MAIDFEIMTGCFGSQAASRYFTIWAAGFGQKQTVQNWLTITFLLDVIRHGTNNLSLFLDRFR
jgi:hypothetical protein